VGALHPRKNLERVTAAFTSLKQRCAGARLVIVGPPSWGAHKTLGHVLSASQGDTGITFTGFVSDEELRALYQGARALVFPSLYEGFGLPALEAMTYGTPVLSSNVSSLPEVVGDAGLLVDPLSTEAIVEAMYALWTDSSLRDALVSRGFRQAQRFTWERTAQRTLEVYRRLLGEPERLTPLTPLADSVRS
jgi:glycosyltransferase involved in cell wall biosynthesis